MSFPNLIETFLRPASDNLGADVNVQSLAFVELGVVHQNEVALSMVLVVLVLPGGKVRVPIAPGLSATISNFADFYLDKSVDKGLSVHLI